MPGPVTPLDVTNYLKMTPGSDTDAIQLDVDAANDAVTDWHGDPAEWKDRILRGAIMLAAKLYRRRSSPGGVETFGDLGPVYIARHDEELSRLLMLGRYEKPKAG